MLAANTYVGILAPRLCCQASATVLWQGFIPSALMITLSSGICLIFRASLHGDHFATSSLGHHISYRALSLGSFILGNIRRLRTQMQRHAGVATTTVRLLRSAFRD